MKFLAVFVLALATASSFETPLPFKDILVDGSSKGRIFGGTTAVDGQFPYQVRLYLFPGRCGGSLISSTVVLTAAHCVDENISGGLAIFGSVRLYAGTSRYFDESAITIHELFNSTTLDNDIALIKIAAVSFSKDIKPVALPARSPSYSNYVGDTVTISGWGKISDTSGTPKNLQYAKAAVISNADCAKNYVYGLINDGTLCISTAERTSICDGDSGGPAVVNGQQVGISSFADEDGCETGYPAGFARVTYYRDWIYNNSGI